jgi:hypothetical protein
MQTINPDTQKKETSAGVGTVDEQETPLELTDEAGELVNLDLKGREGAYWVGWDSEHINLLIKALKTIPRSERTSYESDLLLSEQIRKGEAFSGGSGYAQRYLMGKLRAHGLEKEEINHLRGKKVKAIVNKSDRGKEFQMPPGSGATYLMIPGDGTGENQIPGGGAYVLDAYTEQFVNPDKVRASGMEVVEFDADNQIMNPPQHQRAQNALGYDDIPAEYGDRQTIDTDKETKRIEAQEARLQTKQNIDGLKQAIAEQQGE